MMERKIEEKAAKGEVTLEQMFAALDNLYEEQDALLSRIDNLYAGPGRDRLEGLRRRLDAVRAETATTGEDLSSLTTVWPGR